MVAIRFCSGGYTGAAFSETRFGTRGLASPAMGSRNVKGIVKTKGEIAQVAGALARADYLWSRVIGMGRVEDEQLYLSVRRTIWSLDRGRYVDAIRPHLNILENVVCPIPRGTDKFNRDRVVSAKLANSNWYLPLQASIS